MLRAIGFTALIVSISHCRVRDDESRIKDLTPSITSDTGGLELEIDTKALKTAKFSLSHSNGSLDMWSMLYDDALTKKIQARIENLKIDQKNMIPAADQLIQPANVKQLLSPSSLSFSGIPGRASSQAVSTKSKNGTSMVTSKELSGDFFKGCPSDYFSDSGKLFTNFKRSSAYPAHTSDGDATISVNKVIYRPKGITWLISCERSVGWADIPDTKLLIKMTFEVKLDADQVILPGVASDPKYPTLKNSSITTERSGFGTRYFRDYVAMQPDHTPIQRWNPLRSRIVIDDLHDSFGKPLAEFNQGPWVQEALKIATADLRIKFPALGKKIILTSEQPRLQPDIAFAMGDAMGGAGIALMLLDDNNGEIRQARIGLGEESNLTGRIKMIDGFHKLGLIDDPRKSFRDSYLFTVLHELGHTLGLRHNFSGYGMNQNWGNDLQAVMSYAMIGFPIEFVSDKVEWKPHDVLSLKILYADASVSENRASLISEILRFPLSQDEFFSENIFDFSGHFKTSMKFLESTNHPKFAKFRTESTDWKTKIKQVYKDAYDVDVE